MNSISSISIKLIYLPSENIIVEEYYVSNTNELLAKFEYPYADWILNNRERFWL